MRIRSNSAEVIRVRLMYKHCKSEEPGPELPEGTLESEIKKMIKEVIRLLAYGLIFKFSKLDFLLL